MLQGVTVISRSTHNTESMRSFLALTLLTAHRPNMMVDTSRRLNSHVGCHSVNCQPSQNQRLIKYWYLSLLPCARQHKDSRKLKVTSQQLVFLLVNQRYSILVFVSPYHVKPHLHLCVCIWVLNRYMYVPIGKLMRTKRMANANANTYKETLHYNSIESIR